MASQNEAEPSASRISGGFRIAPQLSTTATVTTTVTVNSYSAFCAPGPRPCTPRLVTSYNLLANTMRQAQVLSPFYRK